MPQRLEYLDRERSSAIQDMLSYQRVLKNQTQKAVAEELGLPLNTYAPVERGGYTLVPVDMLATLERYIGCDVNTLVDHAEHVVGIQKELQQELGQTLIEVGGNNSAVRKGHLRLHRRYEFDSASDYFTSVFYVGSLHTPDLPHLSITFDHADFNKLTEDKKIPLVENLTTVPFREVYRIIQAKL